MNEAKIRKEVDLYFKTLEENGRTVSKKVNPKERIIVSELKFLKYLDETDLWCMFCSKPLRVIVMDYNRQRPVWGCLTDKFTKGLQKIKWLGHCGDCGKKLIQDASEQAYQKKYLDRDNVVSVCDKCCGTGNILEEEDMKNVKKKVLSN